MIEEKFVTKIAAELSLKPEQVERVVALLDGGATLPFIARYRKDVTGNLDETVIEAVSDRNAYFSSLMDRRKSIAESLDKQGVLNDALRKAMEECFDKTALENLYLPYKKKRRTKATVAKEKGLAPLADFLWEQEPGGQPINEFAAAFVRSEKAIASVDEAFEGARCILAERMSLDVDAREMIRRVMAEEGTIKAYPTKNAEGKKTKYEAYYEFSEPANSIASHRVLAILRGDREGLLRTELAVDDESLVAGLVGRYLKEPDSEFAPHIRATAEDAYHRLIRASVENEVMGVVRARADEDAIHVFRENARNLLLAPPAGQLVVLGVDPGLRTGCKLAVIDGTGVFTASAVIYPGAPRKDDDTAETVLLALIEKHGVQAVAIGNGTGSREVSRFIRSVLGKIPGKSVFSVLTNEAGASIYSTSPIAREEFPDLDATIRSAIAIARRLQDPLAELVKVDPRHIGVGQYQHDVNQKRLRQGLARTVSSCVNAVGVDLNTASPALLRYVSGVQTNVAKSIVEFRTQLGGFASRAQLLEVDGVGPKAFEQCAGFLRIAGGHEPLDNTGIHPEAYPIVERVAEAIGVTKAELVNKPEKIRDLDLGPFGDDTIGPLALEDIRRELLSPRRDPRTEFRIPAFKEGVDSVAQLEEGMDLEGMVTNVTDFGAFVDVGVHHDGLVHLSELAHRFVRDPREVVKVGEIVRVRVVKLDKDLPRISLSMKALEPAAQGAPRRQRVDGQAAEHREAENPFSRGGSGPGTSDPRRRGPGQGDGQREPGRARRRGSNGGDRPRRGGARANRAESMPRGQQAAKQTPLNTQLADQLADLKKKLGS